jgi:hypothetical protein
MDVGLLPELLSSRWGRALLVGVLLMSLDACFIGGDDGSDPVSRTVTSTSSASPSPERPSSRSSFAIWPESDAGEAAAAMADGEQPWRLLAVDVAVRFARQVLGWHPAARLVAESPYGATYRVWDTRHRERAVELTLAQPTEPLWSVVSLRGVGSLADVTPGVGIRRGRVDVSIVPPDGRSAEAIEVVARFGGLHGRAFVGPDGRAAIRLQGPTQVAGYLLFLWRDGDGNVVSAFGSAFPAGTTAAG